MGKLNDIVLQLFQEKQVQLVIGYEECFNGNKVRPIFLSTTGKIEKLLYDNRCKQNLALYLNRIELIGLKKLAIVSNLHTLRGIIRLTAEKQICNDNLIIAIHFFNEKIYIFRHLEEIEKYLFEISNKITLIDNIQLEQLERLDKISTSERWNFWKEEMKNCIRCYACRQACPLCYCSQCTVEINQPQWIPVHSTQLGNIEWHVMRAMHLAGRCVECGSCGEVCPVHIPIHLLPMRLEKEIKILYGSITGMNQKEPCVMSTYQFNDSETFIK